LKKKTFKGGIHPPYSKDLTRKNSIKKIPAPEKVVIPLVQHIGTPCSAVKNIGESVKIGTKIADSEKFISAPIHSSVSGTIKAIKNQNHPILGRCESILIESDGKDEIDERTRRDQENIESLSPDQIREIVKESGIVGMGGAAFPTHVKLNPPKDKPINTFILNGAECEPYLTCDERIMAEKPKKVLQGTFLLMKALGISSGIIAIEDNKPEAIEAMCATLRSLKPAACNLRIITLHTKYPQGGEKQLIKAVTKKEVPVNGLPLDIGCVVDNIQTALAVYEAVYEGKPLYERVVTVSGDAIREPSNLLVRIGTPISYIIEKCEGLKNDAARLVSGGPMMGLAQYSDESPIIKGSSGLLVLSKRSAKLLEVSYCIRCGKCIDACPVHLLPTDIAKVAEHERFDRANELNAVDCMECGCCAYVCPSSIPLVQLIRHAKKGILCQI